MAQGNINISSSSYGKVSDGISVTISNPNGYTITQLGFTFSFKSTNGVKHDFTLQCDQYSGWSDMTATSNGNTCYGSVTVNLGSGTSSKSFSLSFSCPWVLSYCQITGVSLDDAKYTVNEYDYAINYYKDGSLYDSWSDTSTNTTYSKSLISLPSASYYYGTESYFTITGDVNTGVTPNKTCTATVKPHYKVTYSGWYNGRYATSGKVSSPYVLAKNETLNLNAASGNPVVNEYFYSNNTIDGLATPTKNSLIETTTVTFDANGGSVSPSKKESTKTTTYKFNGWWNATSGGTKYTSDNYFSQAITVYAQWTSSSSGSTTVSSFPDASRSATNGTYTVKFVDSDGSTSISSNKTNSYSITYTFNGWYTAKTGGTKKTSSSSSTTLYAQWTQNAPTYTSITLPTVSKTGYNFSHWTDTSTNKNYDAGASYTPSSTGTSTLKAVWTASTYEVKYNGNGHTGGSMENSIHTIGQSSNLSDNKYIKEYILSFDSIHIENSGNNNNNDNINNSLLPSGFIQLDYIQANYNQFLNTEYNFTTNNVKIYLEYKNLNTDSIMAYNGNLAICGAEDTIPSDGTYDMCGGILFTNGSATNYRLNVGNAAAPLTNINIPRDEKLTIEINCSSEGTRRSTYSIFINGIKQQSLTADSHFKNEYEYYIFGYNLSGTPKWLSAGNLYRCIMYDDDLINPVRDFIPCKRISDNAIGVYDLVEARFYQSGSGVAFVAGNEIENDEPEIDVEDEIITYDGIKVTYTHNGWYSDASCSGSPITSAYNLTSAGNVYNVYAGWTQNNYVLPIPKKEGYTFLGWYDSQGNLITNNSLITSNLFLTAQWVESSKNKIIIYTDNAWKKAITLIYKNNTWQEYDFNIK